MNIVSETIKRTFYSLPKIPRYVQIEVTNRCNLNCKMCPRKYLNVKYEDMSFDIFKKTIEKLNGVEEIILTGWGEPLIHPKIFDMIKYCKKKGFKTSITTNGLLLTNKLQKKIIKSGLDNITFSIDSIDSNPLAHFNSSTIKNLEELKKVVKRGKPKITIQSTIHKNKGKDIYDVITYAAKTGIKRVNLTRLDIRFNKNLKRPSVKEEKEIFKNAEKIGKKLGLQVDFVPLAIFCGFNRKMYKMFKKTLHRFGSFCPKTYDYCYVNFEGFVTPCCNLPHLKIGDLKTEKIKKIWNSNNFMLFRKNQKKICAGCDVLEIK